MIKPWKRIETRTVKETRIFTLKVGTARAPKTGRDHDFYLLDAAPWVNIVALTGDDHMLFVRQYRHGTEEVTLEIPGGLVEAGQTPEEAAGRELMEETGHRAEEMILMARVRPNPAFLNNWCYLYLAKNVAPAGELELDETEDIEVVRIPAPDIPGLIEDGTIDHSLVLSAFFHYYRRYGVSPD